MFEDDFDWLNVIRYVVPAIFAIITFLFFGYLFYSSSRAISSAKSVSVEIDTYFKEEKELLDGSTIEDSTAIVLDKIIKELDSSSSISTNYIISPSMILPIVNTTPSYNSTFYKINIELEDGVKKEVIVTEYEFSNITVGDSIDVLIYRNDKKFDLRKGSTDNIVSVELK